MNTNMVNIVCLFYILNIGLQNKSKFIHINNCILITNINVIVFYY